MPTFLVLPFGTVEYIRNQVDSESDLTSLPVETAMITTGAEPVNLDWQTAFWEPDNVVVWLYPGNLAAGNYDYWVRITATPEIPVRNTGIVILTP